MKGIKKVMKNVDIKDFKKYLLFSFLFVATLIAISTIDLTKSRYENETYIRIKPTLAFFVVDVTTQSGQIKLESMTPRTNPYLYTFNVSNFHNNKRANVDLTYTIEIITTTNMPLTFQIYRGNGVSQNEIDSDVTTTNDDGVYFRHLVINDTNTMLYTTNTTDVYTLSVTFPETYKANADDYAGIIDLVDIKINAEQVV